MPEKPTPTPVTIVIDGKEVPAEKGEMVIAAADRAGIHIPRFCWHPRMDEVGMCRMCIIEQKGPRGWGLAPACYVPANDGAEFQTQSPTVKKIQDGVLEFLLINHPLDCPVCDKGGECPLQDNTLAFGPGESRFVEEKVHFEKPIPVSDLVLLDRERCIVCARCTRFADEIAGDPLLTIGGRGEVSEIITFPNDPFSSYFSGNTVQICPVGALTATPYRFKARPWDLEQVESTCTTCSVGCRIAVQSSQNQITRFLGVDVDPVNHGWLCDKGRFGYEAINNLDERLTQPLVRKGGELVPVDWSEALEAAATGLGQALDLHGPESVGFVGGARLPNEDAYVWARLAKGVLRTDNTDAQVGDGLDARLVATLPPATIDDACWADTLLLIAPDLKEELPVLYLRLKRAIEKNGVKVVELSPVPTGLTRYAAHSLRHRAGEAHLIVKALLAGDDARNNTGGVEAAALNEARKLLAGDGTVVAVVGRQSLADSGDAIAAAAMALREAKPDATFLPVLRRGNVRGALDAGLTPGFLPGRVTLEEGRDWYTGQWGGVPESEGMNTEGMMLAAAEGRLHGLVLLGADPMADLPDRDLAKRAMVGAGFVVAVDTFLNDSNRYADVIFPAAAFAERPGTTTNIEGRVSRLSRKLVPPGFARPDWLIAVELAYALTAELDFANLVEVRAEMSRVSPLHAGLTTERLSRPDGRDGLLLPLTWHEQVAAGRVGSAVPTSAAEGEALGNELINAATGPGFTDPAFAPGTGDGKSAAAPAAAPAAAGDEAAETDGDGEDVGDLGDLGDLTGRGRPAMVQDFQAPVVDLPHVDSYALRLVAARRLYDQGTMVRHAPHLTPLTAEPGLRVNPSDLARIGLGEGGQARVVSNRSAVTVEVRPDATIPKGTGYMTWNTALTPPGDLIDVDNPVTDVRLESL